MEAVKVFVPRVQIILIQIQKDQRNANHVVLDTCLTEKDVRYVM